MGRIAIGLILAAALGCGDITELAAPGGDDAGGAGGETVGLAGAGGAGGGGAIAGAAPGGSGGSDAGGAGASGGTSAARGGAGGDMGAGGSGIGDHPWGGTSGAAGAGGAPGPGPDLTGVLACSQTSPCPAGAYCQPNGTCRCLSAALGICGAPPACVQLAAPGVCP